MARQSIGHVIERPWSDGQTVSYGARVRAYGRYEKVTFGTNKQGWNRTRAELETERIVQQIERGTWVPPRLEPRKDRLRESMAALGVQVDETFQVFAKRWWRSKQLGLDEDTVNDYEWRLGYLERFFGRYRLSEITPQLIDRFRDELYEQGKTIRRARLEVDLRPFHADLQLLSAKGGLHGNRPRSPPARAPQEMGSERAKLQSARKTGGALRPREVLSRAGAPPAPSRGPAPSGACPTKSSRQRRARRATRG